MTIVTRRPQLRDYQVSAIEAVEKAEGGAQHYCLVSLPTGTGKTLVFCELIRRRGGRALVIAHRDELLAQAQTKLVAAGIGAGTIGWVKAGRDEVSSPLVLASMQTLARRSRRERVIAAQAEAGMFTTIVIDEAHHVPATSYLDFLDAMEDAIGPDDEVPLVLGVTATPARAGVDDVFGPPVFSRDLIDMIAEGWLVDLRGRRVGIDLDLGSIRKSHGDYVEADLARALGEADAPSAVVDAWCEHSEDRQTLCFTAGVALAHETAQVFRDRDIAAEAIDGAMPLDDRRAVLDRYRAGETTVLVNCAVLTEGVDLPDTACIVVSRPTISPILYAQMVGRGSRLAPGKSDCLILDLAGATDRHDLSALGRQKVPVSLGSLAGVTLDEGASLLDTALKDRTRRERLAVLLGEHGRLVGEDVSLFGRRQLRWLTLPGPHPVYVLGIGDAGHVVLASDGASTFTVHRIPPYGTPELLGEGLRIDAATATAEQAAWSHRATHLASVSAKWRSLPASQKQVNFLVSVRRVPRDVAATLTRGQASDLLDATIAARRVEQARKEGASVHSGRPRKPWCSFR